MSFLDKAAEEQQKDQLLWGKLRKHLKTPNKRVSCAFSFKLMVSKPAMRLCKSWIDWRWAAEILQVQNTPIQVLNQRPVGKQWHNLPPPFYSYLMFYNFRPSLWVLGSELMVPVRQHTHTHTKPCSCTISHDLAESFATCSGHPPALVPPMAQGLVNSRSDPPKQNLLKIANIWFLKFGPLKSFARRLSPIPRCCDAFDTI